VGGSAEFYAFRQSAEPGSKRPAVLLAACGHPYSGHPEDDWLVYRGNEVGGYDFVAWYISRPENWTRVQPDPNGGNDVVEIVDLGRGAAAASGGKVVSKLHWSATQSLTKGVGERTIALRDQPKAYTVADLRSWSRAEDRRIFPIGGTVLRVVAICRRRDKTFPLDLWYVFVGADPGGYGIRFVYARSGPPVEPRYDASTGMFSLSVRETPGASGKDNSAGAAEAEVSAEVPW
jgi:hypothetical protein